MKHTQEPWETEGLAITSKQFDICELYGGAMDCDENLIDKESLQANARLIAAAPELLKALQKAQFDLEFYQDMCIKSGKTKDHFFLDSFYIIVFVV